MQPRMLWVVLIVALFATACGSSSERAGENQPPPTTPPVPTVTSEPTSGFDPTPQPTVTPVPTTTPAPATTPVPTSVPAPTEPPLGAGPYAVADLSVAYDHPDQSLDYRIACQGDTATTSGDADQAGVIPAGACSALAEAALAQRLIDGPPGDRICTEIYGGPDTATVTGTLDGEAVDTEFDRTDGCAIDEWDDLAAPILPPAEGASEPDIDPTPALSQRCTSPEGFTIAYPDGWHTNDGSVVAACSQFDPQPFDVPPATDQRVAAITAYVDDIAYSALVPGNTTIDGSTAYTTIDGHQALRRSGAYDGSGLYPAGTPVTTYLIDLALGVDDGPGTMFVDVVGVGDVHHDAIRPVLDAMARTIDIGTTDTNPSVIARYEGGATPFIVTAEPDGRLHNVCLRMVGRQTQACVDVTSSSRAADLTVAQLDDDSLTVLAGTVGSSVFSIDARSAGGELLFTYLPVPVVGIQGVSAWALPLSIDDAAELVLRDRAGNRIATRTLARTDDPEPDPIGRFDSVPVVSTGFPGSGMPVFLEDVRIGVGHGFQRVVFEFTEGETPTFRVELVEAMIEPSGETADIDGERLLSVILTPATTVDLSGEQPVVRYDGPTRLTPSSTELIAEIALVSDFESTLDWGIGINGDVRFAVAALVSPPRVVVDLAG